METHQLIRARPARLARVRTGPRRHPAHGFAHRLNMEVGAFDIGGAPEIGYVVITDNALSSTKLYQINLATGALATVGDVARPASLLKSIALSP